MLMIPARLGRSESFWVVVMARSPHTGSEFGYPESAPSASPHLHVILITCIVCLLIIFAQHAIIHLQTSFHGSAARATLPCCPGKVRARLWMSACLAAYAASMRADAP